MGRGSINLAQRRQQVLKAKAWKGRSEENETPRERYRGHRIGQEFGRQSDRMKAWLIQIGEPLPDEAESGRLMRTGLFAQELVKRGHDVTWWSSGFSHAHKRMRSVVDCIQDVGESYRIRLIACPPYSRNVGLRRIVNHRIVARRFAALARETARPDVIVCSYPTIELSREATRYGKDNGIPVVLDVRDLWPDLFLDLMPDILKPVVKLLLKPMFCEAGQAFRDATAIIAITESYLAWALKKAGRARGGDAFFPMGYPSWQRDSAGSAIEDSVVLGQLTNPDHIAVCFFGTISRQFDLATVIEAARILREKGVIFVLCGMGERLGFFRQMARGLKNVLFPGHVGRAEIQAIMQRSVMGLAPYRVCENFNLNVPNKIYEYLSGGLPILSPLGGEVRRLLEDCEVGLHYTEGDAKGLAKCILDLQNNPQRLASMGRAASRLFEGRYRAEMLNEKMADYIDHIARSHAPR